MIKIPLSSQTSDAIERVVAASHQSVGIVGAAGSGKGSVAYRLAADVVNVPVETIQDYPYLIRVNHDSSGISVEAVRAVQRQLSLTVPGEQSIRRLVIFEDFDTAGLEAQNALLKTLEEPPSDTMILLTFSDSMAVLPTIQSRLSAVVVRPITYEAALLYGRELGVDLSTIKRAYHMSAGQAGLFAALIHEVDHPLIQSIEAARNLLSASRFERIAAIDGITKQKNPTPILIIDALYRLLRASYHLKLESSADDPRILEVTVSRMNLVDQAFQDLRHNVNSKLVLTRLFARL